MTKRDFGYSRIDWERASAENVKAMEAEYRLRLDSGCSAGGEIDQKARFVFTGLIGLATALLGWTFSQASGMTPDYRWGLYALAAILVFASALAVVAMYPRNYRYPGATPTGLDVAAWQPLIYGGEPDLLRLSGVRIKEYAISIDANEISNKQKSTYLSAAMIFAVAAFPLSVLVVFSLRFYPALSNAPGLTIGSPIHGLWFFVGFIGGIIVGTGLPVIFRRLPGHWLPFLWTKRGEVRQ